MNAWGEARSILAVRMDNAGDVVLLEPALRCLKATLPKATITLLASPAGAKAAPLLPWIDDVISWRALWQDAHGNLSFFPERELELVRILNERGFDAAIIFTSFSQTPHPAAYVCYLAGIPLRAGESTEFGGACLTTEVRDLPRELHQAERSLRLIEALGFKPLDRHVRIDVVDGPRRAAVLLESIGLDPRLPFAVVHPGATAEARRYREERFAEVARLLTEKGEQVVITAVEKERECVERIRDQAPSAAVSPLNMDIVEYAALLGQAEVVICNNSFPLHVADGTGTPVVAVYSGTDLESQWRPRRSKNILLRRPTVCHPCYRFDCPIGKPCLDVEPQEVVQAVESLISARRKDLTPVTTSRGKGPQGGDPRATWSPFELEHRREGSPTRKEIPHPGKIAVVRALHLGDMLLAVPALRAIRALYPRAEITLIGLPWARTFSQRFSRYIDRFVEFPGFRGIAEAPYHEEKTIEFLRQEQAYKYDLAIQLHGSGSRSNAFVRALGAIRTAGFYHHEDPHCRLDIAAPYPEDEPEVDRNLDLVRLLGCFDLDRRLEFPLYPDDLAEADALLQNLDTGLPIVVIHPGAHSSDRRWPADRYSQLGTELARKLGASIVITGSAEEADLAERVMRGIAAQALNLAGRTSVGGLAAVISSASLFAGNDSGPAHLAEAVTTPSVVLFGSQDPERWGPIEPSRHRVLRRKNAHGEWRVDAITTEEVLSAALEMVAPVSTPIGRTRLGEASLVHEWSAEAAGLETAGRTA